MSPTTFFGLVIGLFILVLFAAWLSTLFVDPVEKFVDQCRKQGMDAEEISGAIGIRMAMIRLRRIASDLCHDRGGDMERWHIDEIAEVIGAGLAAAHNQQTCKSFLAWVKSCPDHEILYEDARELRHQFHKSQFPTPIPVNPQDLEDLRAAFRVVR